MWRKRQHVLVVEDTEERQRVFRRHYPHCRLATTYEEAVEALQGTRYDVVYLDHNIVGRRNGTDIAYWMTRMAKERRPNLVLVHSTHDAGALAIYQTLKGAGFHVLSMPFRLPFDKPTLNKVRA